MNLFKIAHDQALSALERRAPHTAAAVRTCEAADEDLAAALLTGAAEAAEAGCAREDILERLHSAVSACWDGSAKPDILLLVSELCD